MKKNYSESFLKPPNIITPNTINSSIQKRSQNHEGVKKLFKRKPAGGILPLSRKKGEEPGKQIDSTMQQTSFSVLLEQSKTLKFISCRSQTSLNCSIMGKSNSSLSFAYSRNQQRSIQQQSCKFLPEESILLSSPGKQSNSREFFRRKTVYNLRTTPVNKPKLDSQSLNTSTVKSRFGRKLDHAEQQTKLESSQISEISKSFCTPISLLISKNLFQGSKNSSKDSMRKSNSSGSLRKNQPNRQQCSNCDFHQRELKQAFIKNQRLQRMLQHKEEQIKSLNKRIQQNEKRKRQLDKKVKEFQNKNFENKINDLEQQLINSQEESHMLKQAYANSLQELKYKNVQNTTLKKYQSQCQSLQRKLQLLVSQRNELRQRLSNVNVSAKSSYMNYPSSLSRQPKSISQFTSNLAVHNYALKGTQKDSKRQSYTSRNEHNGQDGLENECEGDKSFRTMNSEFKKKSAYDKCYDDGSESELISLSELSQQIYF